MWTAERGARITLELGAMVHGGACLAHLEDGTAVFVDGGIPGETCDVELRYRRKKSWFGRVVEVATASPQRVDAPCPYVGECGGCQLQHISYTGQLDLKRAIVEDAFRRQHVPLPETVPVHGMGDPWRYRWRGEWHVLRHGDDVAFGFNRARSWSKVAVADCLIHHQTITAALPALGTAVRTGGHRDLTLLHMTVGEEGHELLIRPKPKDALDRDAVDAVAVETGARWSVDATTLRWRGMSFRVTSETFIQVNWRQMDVLYGLVLDAIGAAAPTTVVDAYAGIGVMSCAMAQTGSAVVCIESNPHSCRMGLLNADMAGVRDRIRYVAEPVEAALGNALADARPEVVILDPPRAGCESSVTGLLALAGPPRIVYVSCDPATLARDLRILCVSGPYHLAQLDLVDMFPQTHHIECVAQLERTPIG